jgi:beta-1,4-N-acetylglucosaminyltransferase
MKVFIVSSLGGHLVQMQNFYNNSPQNHEYFLITEDRITFMNVNWFDGKRLLIKSHGGGYKVYFNLFLNIILGFVHFIKYRPDVIISAGSHTCIPYFLLGKIFRVKTIYILSFARRKTRAKTADILYKIADVFVVQWEEAKLNYPNSIYLNSTFYI